MHLRTKIFHKICPAAFLSALVFAIVSVSPSFVHADESTQEYEQVGAYSQLENAATMVESFRMEGKNAFIRQKTINGQVLYVVIIDHSAAPPEKEPGAGPMVVSEPGIDPETGGAIAEPQGMAEEIILPTYSGMPGSSIAVKADTPLYSEPEDGAAKVGVYSSIEGGRYSSTLAGFHMVWFPSVEEYGYVKAGDVRIVQYDPQATLQSAPADEQDVADDAQDVADDAQDVADDAQDVADAATDKEAAPEAPMEAPVDDMEATAPMVAGAPSEPEPEPEPQMVKEDTGPHLLIVPVTSADKTLSIEIMSDIELYDRPFASGKAIGTFDELGGVFIKEYMGWYALRLLDGRNVFIRMEDATPVSK